MAWTTIVLMALLVAFNLNLTAATQIIKVKELCPNSPLQGTFNQIFSNLPFVQLSNGTDSAAKVHQFWDEERLKEFQDCSFHVDSNLYFDGGDPDNAQRFGRGLTMSVRKINFRYDPITNQCIDYVRFTFPDTRTDKICGTFDGESEIGQQTYFNEPNGIIKVHIFVDTTIPLNVSETSVEIELFFTAYEHCSGNNLIQCSPDDQDFCISDTLKNDGIHNCPPPSNADEPNLPFPSFGSQQQQQQPQQQRRRRRRLTGDASPIRPKSAFFYLIALATLMIKSTMF